jgi:hypothetical protein
MLQRNDYDGGQKCGCDRGTFPQDRLSKLLRPRDDMLIFAAIIISKAPCPQNEALRCNTYKLHDVRVRPPKRTGPCDRTQNNP